MGSAPEPGPERQKRFRTEGSGTLHHMTSPHLGLLAGDKAELLKDLHQDQLHHQLSEPHADAVPGSCSEGQVSVRINVLFVFLAEPSEEVNI